MDLQVVVTMRVGSLIVADGFLLLANQLLAQCHGLHETPTDLEPVARYNKVPNFALFQVDGH